MNALTISDNDSLPAVTSFEQALLNFDQIASRFLATRKSEATRQTYQVALEQYRETAKQLGLDPLKADCLIAYNSELKTKRLANDTIRLKLKAIASLFSWCYTFGLSPLKPEQVSELITMPEARKLSPRDILTSDEAKRLLKAAKDDIDRCLLRVMLDAGLRVSEAIALRCGDVYAADDRHFIHVAAGKGDKSRDVPISPDLYQELSQLAQSRDKDLLNPQHAKVKLFGNIYRRKANRIVSRTAKRAGIAKNVTPHSLRHTLGNQLSMLGYPIELIGEMLGHASFDTTKIYTRPASILKQAELPALPW